MVYKSYFYELENGVPIGELQTIQMDSADPRFSTFLNETVAFILQPEQILIDRLERVPDSVILKTGLDIGPSDD